MGFNFPPTPNGCGEDDHPSAKKLEVHGSSLEINPSYLYTESNVSTCSEGESFKIFILAFCTRHI